MIHDRVLEGKRFQTLLLIHFSHYYSLLIQKIIMDSPATKLQVSLKGIALYGDDTDYFRTETVELGWNEIKTIKLNQMTNTITFIEAGTNTEFPIQFKTSAEAKAYINKCKDNGNLEKAKLSRFVPNNLLGVLEWKVCGMNRTSQKEYTGICYDMSKYYE